MSGDRGSVSSVLVCWSLDLGSTPDGSLSFSFPLAFFGLCKSTSKENTSLPGHLRYFNNLSGINPLIMAPPLTRRCYRSIPNGVLTAHDLGGLQCEVAS